MYGATTKGDNGQDVPCKKPTKWATTSPQMAARLSALCDKTHEHQHLMGGRAAAAAIYPLGLITAILRGMRDTADAEYKGDESTPALVARLAMASKLLIYSGRQSG